METDGKPQQLPDEAGAKFAKRLRLMAKHIEGIDGQRTVDSDFHRMKWSF